MSIVKKISDFFTGNNKPFNPSKRKFMGDSARIIVTTGIALSGLEVLTGCKKELLGTPIARPTKGYISDSVIQWLNNDPNGPVFSYVDPLAELLNESSVIETGIPLPSKVSIEFKGSLDGANGNYGTEVELHGTKFRVFDSVKGLKNRKKIPTYRTLVHEITHHEHDDETLPEFRGIRIPLMASLHFPNLGEETDYRLFQEGVLDFRLSSLSTQQVTSGYEYDLSNLASILALNDANGSFSEAEKLIVAKRNYYMNSAQEFIDDSRYKPDVENVECYYPGEIIQVGFDFVQLPDEIRLEKKSHFKIAMEEALSLTTHLVIEEELRRVGQFSPEKAKELRQHARRQSTVSEYSGNTFIGYISLKDDSNSMTKEGLVNELGLYVPPGYTNQIAKGE